MFPEQLIPVFPEHPLIPSPKKYVHVRVQYKGNEFEYFYEKPTKVSEIILHASDKLNLDSPVDDYWQNYNFFIGSHRINLNREIGFYRSLLSSNYRTIHVEDKPGATKMAQKLMNEYSWDEIKIMLNLVIDCKESVDAANESSEEMYKSYLAHKEENDE